MVPRRASNSCGGGQKRQLGAATGTGDRLSMKTAIGRIVVLGLTPGAHLEGPHRRVRPIVGNPGGDREARPAVGAVGEGIAEAAFGRVVDLRGAHLTGRNVRRDRHRGGPAGPAVEYLKVFAARHGDGSIGDGLNASQPGCLRPQSQSQRRQGLRGALGLDGDAARLVDDEAGQAQPGGKPIDMRAKTDPLHSPRDLHAHAPRLSHPPMVAPVMPSGGRMTYVII